VIIPEENEKDLAEIPKNVTESLKIRPVRWIDEVLDIALERPLSPLLEKVENAKNVASEPAVEDAAGSTAVRPH